MTDQVLPKKIRSKRKNGKQLCEFRIGKVLVYPRGKVWYLYYHENGQRKRPRVGTDKEIARQLASQINGQLEVGATSLLSFRKVSLTELRSRWLAHHEHVLRSSLQTINRYRTATEHLLRYVADLPIRAVSEFGTAHAEDFVRHLREIRVAPNGHENSDKRPLLDKGIQYILETCRSLFAYAMKHRHFPPYSENPFVTLDIGRLPVECLREIVLPAEHQQIAILRECDAWQFPIFLTLMLTGLRSGELVHLLLPEDLDFDRASIFVRNRMGLGWQVKTRNEREIPLLPCLKAVLEIAMNGRSTGPAFLRRKFCCGECSLWRTSRIAEAELNDRIEDFEDKQRSTCSRAERAKFARRIWTEWGINKTDRVRLEFIKIAKRIGLPRLTSPKTLRHLFATTLQDANVDPLVRNELMGHAPASSNGGVGLGMTTTYTHTRAETKRRQLMDAFEGRAIVRVAEQWCRDQAESALTNRERVEHPSANDDQ